MLVQVTWDSPVPPFTVPAIAIDEAVTVTEAVAGLVTATLSAGAGWGGAGPA